MSANNFRRSNVNAKTLQITDPARSSFPLGHKNDLTIPFGRLVPVSHRVLIPSDTFQGSISPNFHLEKIATPSIGPVRLDTHTFIVNFRRINRDMRKNLENSQNFFPNFDYQRMASVFFTLLGSFAQTDGSSSYNSFAGLMNRWISGSHISVLDVRSYCNALISLFAYSTGSILDFASGSDDSEKYANAYYQLDKVRYLCDYYTNLMNSFGDIIDSESTITAKQYDPRILFEYCLPMVVKPFFGPSSLFDYLGYPLYTQYSVVARWYRFPSVGNAVYDLRFDGRVSRFNDADCKKWSDAFVSSSFLSTFDPFFAIFAARVYDVHEDGTLGSSSVSILGLFSEMPLRAYYAVWYDYLRNWHVEERKNVLDPDDFSNSLVVDVTANVLAVSFVSYLRLAKMLSFITLQYRDYNSDFLTTIQTDDVFRHVYSPVFAAGTSNGYPAGSDGVPSVGGSDGSEVKPSLLSELGFGTSGTIPDMDAIISVAFPSDVYSPLSVGSNFLETAYQDLQTMRRAGMLERWLARNYYYPDTYVGRLQARFGVRPSDYEILVSNYIGGSETFISGSELVANMSTSETVVGSRNLKADVSLKDSFSGSVSDYSCLISLVSTVPVVSYDVLHPSVRLCNFVDFPSPEFATDTRVEARTCDFLRGFPIKPFIGYVPRYYMFRTAADETHGRFLTDYRSYNWFRDWVSMQISGNDFSLTPYSLRVHLPLDAFIGLSEFDDFAYGDCDCELAINRPLPAAIEVI